MATILTETPSFDSDVTVPSGGDARTATSVRAAFQKLTNRTKYLNDAVESISENFVALVALLAGGPNDLRSVFLPLHSAQLSSGWSPDYGVPGAARLMATADSAIALFPLPPLANGSTLKAVHVQVVPGSGGDMNFKLYRKVGPPIPALTVTVPTLIANGTSSGAAHQALSSTDLSEGIDRSTREHWIMLTAGNDAAANSQVCHGISIEYEDAGPKNW